jgi:FkbM family methyltransferase
MSPKSEVCFFEPMHNAAQIIKENLLENALEGRVFELALGDFDGDGRVYLPEGTSFVTSVTVNRDTTKTPSTSKEIKIGVRRADSLINEKKLLLPGLVKLDVETYEPEVLSGFGAGFPKECCFLIEILSAEIAIRVSHYFSKLEYNFYNIDDQIKSIRKTEFLEKSDFYNYLILPKSRQMINLSGNK